MRRNDQTNLLHNSVIRNVDNKGVARGIKFQLANLHRFTFNNGDICIYVKRYDSERERLSIATEKRLCTPKFDAIYVKLNC